MERIEYVLLEIGAVITAITLFILGYKTIKNQFKGEKHQIFWTSVLVVLAFLSVTFRQEVSARPSCYMPPLPPPGGGGGIINPPPPPPVNPPPPPIQPPPPVIPPPPGGEVGKPTKPAQAVVIPTRPQYGTGLTPYVWEALFHNPGIVLPMWEKWWLRNRLYYLPFKEPITWIEFKPSGETIPVSTELLKQARDSIIHTLEDDKNTGTGLRSHAVLALGKSKDKNVIFALKEIAKNEKDSIVRNVALLALGINGDESVLNDIRPILTDSKSQSSDTTKLSYAALTLGYIKSNDSIEILKTVLNQDGVNKEVQCCALLALGNVGDKSIIPFITKILNEPSRDEVVRAYAAMALGRIKDSSGVPDLKKALTDSHGVIRASVAIALGLIKSPDSKDDLINILKNDKTSEVRAYAAISLAQLGDKSAYPVISQFAKKGDYRLESICVLALGILGNQEAIPELRELVDTKRKLLSYGSAILSLGLLKDKDSVTRLIKIVEKEELDPISWPYAIQALGLIGDPKAIPALEKAFQKAQGRLDLATNAYSNLAVALTMLGKRNETLNILYKQLTNESVSSEIKMRVLHSIGYIGDKTSIEPLVKFYKAKKNDYYLGMTAIFALGYVMDKDEINPLYRITANNNFDIQLDVMDWILMGKPD